MRSPLDFTMRIEIGGQNGGRVFQPATTFFNGSRAFRPASYLDWRVGKPALRFLSALICEICRYSLPFLIPHSKLAPLAPLILSILFIHVQFFQSSAGWGPCPNSGMARRRKASNKGTGKAK